jgi:hypothetical protein
MGGKHIEWLMVHKAPSEACDRAMVRALLHYRTKIGHSPTAAEVARDLGMNRNRTAKVLKDIELVHNDISSSTVAIKIPRNVLEAPLSPEAKCVAGFIVARSARKQRTWTEVGIRSIAEDLGLHRCMVERAWKRILDVGVGGEYLRGERRKRFIDPYAKAESMHASETPRCTPARRSVHASETLDARQRDTHRSTRRIELIEPASPDSLKREGGRRDDSVTKSVREILGDIRWVAS